MKKNVLYIIVSITGILLSIISWSCTSIINTNYNKEFDEGGHLKEDSTRNYFSMRKPQSVKFYVEVSGSMNGFFRSNMPTYFKEDLWRVISYYSSNSDPITILTNSGKAGMKVDLANFQNIMNTGGFLSNASTQVPIMLKTIINNLDIEKGEVAVLVSDMKYSPVGADAPKVLITQYSTDISKIFSEFNNAASLICATSNYFFYDKKKHHLQCEQRSPYYYLILGKDEYVASMRNDISQILDGQGRFIDNIESGLNYETPKYSFGYSNRCDQLEKEPTFINYEEAEDGDTCKVILNLQLEDYPWILADQDCLRSSFKVKSLYNSQVNIGSIKTEVKNTLDGNHKKQRSVIAKIELNICNLVTDSEVLEWTLDFSNINYGLMDEFFNDAIDENDPSKSYSVLNFVQGMLQGGGIPGELRHNYILISKNN